jgi:RimJ/RimL family protein N-acetyltransferase
MLDRLVAKTIHFKCAEVSDSEFILKLRTDSSFNKFLSATKSDIEQQKQWLSGYKERERLGKEYYFIIYRNDNNERIGTVRLYDFIKDKNSFCWGSWILNSNKTNSAALESALLVYLFAFNTLGFDQSHFDVRKMNAKVIGFHKKMGAEEVSSNDVDLFFIYRKNTFEQKIKNYKKFLE